MKENLGEKLLISAKIMVAMISGIRQKGWQKLFVKYVKYFNLYNNRKEQHNKSDTAMSPVMDVSTYLDNVFSPLIS